MKNKSVVIVAGIVLVLLLACLVVPSLFEREEKLSNLPKEVVVTQYVPGDIEIVKEITIDNKEEIEELSNYVSKLKPLEEHEMVNLALLQEIEIIYGNSIIIGIQLDEEGYCYYENKDKNISSLSKMPFGLVKWVKDNLDLGD